jgi:hypothetical protein
MKLIQSKMARDRKGIRVIVSDWVHPLTFAMDGEKS